jgi:4-hydroxythreonine-4-phosphate dehydrogenase
MSPKKSPSPEKNKPHLPRIGISIGDPGGIGPEVTLKALGGRGDIPPAHYILFGSSLVLRQEIKAMSVHFDIHPYDPGSDPAETHYSLVEIESPLEPMRSKRAGKSSIENGLASFLYFQEAVDMARKGKLKAVVTAPISKKSWALAGIHWKGHTEYLAHYYPEAIMAFWSGRMKVALLSHHLSLKKALKRVTRGHLGEFFSALHRSVERFRPGRYEFLVSGLNPHAGEEGLLGNEEAEEIIPAIRLARKKGLRISGPYPPDVVFRNALDKPDKIIVALYHDQGLIAFKMVAFDSGVNLSLGLPFIRTSPDHGTAFDIAGRGVADAGSMAEAVKLACELAPLSL